MIYVKSLTYGAPKYRAKIMGPNPIKLAEELLINHKISPNAKVLDLGSGQGLTSVFMAKEYGFRVWAADLWSNPEENRAFFIEEGLSPQQITPVKADAENLPFEPNFFDAVISIDSYNYFGRNDTFLDAKLLPFVKKGGLIYLSFPGMKHNCHSNLPKELLLSWTPEQLDYMQDIDYWRRTFEHAKGARLLSISEMESHDEVWQDWLEQDNPYAIGDRKSMTAGGGAYLNFIAVVLQKE